LDSVQQVLEQAGRKVLTTNPRHAPS
jgi:hypothetical protein